MCSIDLLKEKITFDRICIFVFVLLEASVKGNSPNSEIQCRDERAVFTRGSAIGYIMAVAVPIDTPRRNVFASFTFEANYALPFNQTHKDFIDRWDLAKKSVEQGKAVTHRRSIKEMYTRTNFYRFIMNHLELFKHNGRSCLLRTICEISQLELKEHNGVLGDLFHVLFLPSTSKEEFLHDDFYQAELNGNNCDCLIYHTDCPASILDFITKDADIIV